MLSLISLLSLLFSSVIPWPTVGSTEYFVERDCLAENLYYEARGSTEQDQIAVGYVTLNRVNDRRWPSTICGVVFDPHQFSWTSQVDREMRNPVARDRAIRLADCIMNHECVDRTHGATHYHRYDINPYWSVNHSGNRIGAHIYYNI